VIVTRTPFRISLFGGGTDYPQWYREHGGAVLGFAIDKYCYIFIRRLPPFFSHKHRIVYSQIELPRDIEEIRHPAVRAVMSEMAGDIDGGLEIQHMGDLPARSGLGSSSSFTVGLINAIHAAKGRLVGPKTLAVEAIRIEQEVIREAVGSQDQVWAACGGLGTVAFHISGDFHFTPLVMAQARQRALSDCLMLFFTGQSRFAASVASEKIKSLSSKARELDLMRQMVDEGVAILQQGNRSLDELGKLLHEGWKLKRGLASSVSNDEIDDIYTAGIEAGAVGGKLLGAGGGGFMLFYARPECHAEIRRRLKGLVEIDFEIGSPGSAVIQYDSFR
jgi:D-glycero-alpha-D-manno-heptose-7-phosphate kinase